MRKIYTIILISFFVFLLSSRGFVLPYGGDDDGDGGEHPSFTIVATKILCESELNLPNWSGSSTNITSSNVSDFLMDHPNCHPEPDWQFQWGTRHVTDPGGSFVGIAESPWTTFSSVTD